MLPTMALTVNGLIRQTLLPDRPMGGDAGPLQCQMDVIFSNKRLFEIGNAFILSASGA